MPRKAIETKTLDFEQAAQWLETHWTAVVTEGSANPDLKYFDDPALREAIRSSVGHRQVAYRFCLPVQLLGKLTDPSLDCLRLQKKKGDKRDVTGWDARSLASKVVAPFNQRQENILGTSSDPYVGNPMRIPRMVRNDKSKKDVAGWNTLVDVLQEVERRGSPEFTERVFREVLLEMFRRQKSLRFNYPLPPRISLESALSLIHDFLEEKSGGDRGLAVCGALFDVIGSHFGLYAKVDRARINASDEATGQAADLECVNEEGAVVLAVEVKERTLTLTDVEGTLRKARQRRIKDIFFSTPGIKKEDESAIKERIKNAFASGQNLHVFDFFDLARSVLALGGEAIRSTFIKQVGEHLDLWNTQPAHRQAWKKLLESV
jgi:hypothetical protein